MGTGQQAQIDRAFLASVPIFAGLPEQALAKIAQLMRCERLSAGAELFRQGEPARCMYVVQEGELEICKRREHGAEHRLRVLGRGACIGEMALIEVQARSATVRALGPAAVYALDHADIARLYHDELQVYTLLMLNLARELSRRLRLADER